MPDTLAPIASQSQYLIKIGNVEGYWQTKTGGELSRDASDEYDGGNRDPDVLLGPRKYSDLVVGRPYRPRRDANILAFVKQTIAKQVLVTVSVTPTDADLIPAGKAEIYQGYLVGVTPPEADRNSNAPSRMQFTMHVVSSS